MILWKPTWSTLRSELKEDISRLSLIVTFSIFYSLVLQPWSFTSRGRKILFKALFSCLEFWLCLQTCLSPTYILLPLSLWINYLTPSFSPLFFFNPFSLAMSTLKAQDVCSQGQHQSMVYLNPTPQNKFPASLGWNIFQVCRIFTAFRLSKSLGSKCIFFPLKSYGFST